MELLLLILLITQSFLLFYVIKKQNHFKNELHKTVLSARQYESKMSSLHLQSLESKLNPHLFKNILNSIQSHAYQTYYSLDKLANVLDYILYESRTNFVTPKEEIEFAKNLIEINKIKLSPLFELKVKEIIQENNSFYVEKTLAPFISIDLIENAFKHADLQSAESFISITFEFKESCFMLTVSNKISSKTALKKEKAGIGIETLEQRLKLIYKDKYKIERYSEGDVYIAHLKIDLIEHKTEMHIAG
jgi:LytS/YehU family sensor histidine kinase